MAVAIAALVMATAGTAMAGVAAISSLTAKDKKQVKKIATAQVKKLAPNLSVSKAKTSGTATNATNATNATVAGNVSNQFWARVRSDGTLRAGTPGVSSDRVSQGVYKVTIPPAVATCFYVGSLGGRDVVFAPTPGEISVNHQSGEDNSVRVHTFDIVGSAADLDFMLLIRC